MIGERIEVTSMIDIDLHSVYHFVYPLFCSLPDLTTETNSFDDCALYLNWSHATLLDISEPNSRWAEPFDETALTMACIKI